MPKATDCWGIEVGSNAIKAIRLQRQGADVSIVDFDVIPFKKILTTPDLDVDEAIRVGLDQFVNRHNLSKSGLVVSVPGHMAFARFAKLPPVEPKKIPDIVRFEAVQQIPFPIEAGRVGLPDVPGSRFAGRGSGHLRDHQGTADPLAEQLPRPCRWRSSDQSSRRWRCSTP
jgi:hypothetical protein